MIAPLPHDSETSRDPSGRRARHTALLPLGLILLLQSVASLSLHNTAYLDEALYLWAGRQIVHHWQGGPPTDDFAQLFSGTPYLYPVLGGLLDSVGGLEAARLFSLACMLGATVAVYALTQTLYDRRSAVFAAALFAGQGSVLFLGHFATYDALCLALLAGATLLALKAGAARTPAGAFAVGAALLLAVAAKYAGLLYVPMVLLIFGWQTARSHGWAQALLRSGIALAVMAYGALLLVLVAGHSIWDGLNSTTLNRTAFHPASPWWVARRALSLGGGFTLLAALGWWLDGRRRGHPIWVALLATAFLAPAYHIADAEAMSLHKHIAYGLFFAAPLAGYAADRLCSLHLSSRRWAFRSVAPSRRPDWLAGAAVCALLFVIGISQAYQEFHGWRNTDASVRALRASLRPGDHILAEMSEVPRYYLQDKAGPQQWSNFPWFQYGPSALHGTQAFQAATDEGYFDLVILHYEEGTALAHRIDPILNDGKHYTLIVKQPGFWIWRRKKAAIQEPRPSSNRVSPPLGGTWTGKAASE